jgi:drug/metabolite transporter (DMT)-like permease
LTIYAVDNALARAPNAGACKNVINLNGVWALLLGTLFLNGKLTPKLGLGSTLVVIGAYLSS